MKHYLLSHFGGFGLAMFAVSVVVGPILAQTTGGGGGADWTTGGIATGALAFCGATVRYMGGLVDKERARGDRLELALIDKTINAMGSSAEALKDLSREVRENRRAK